MALLTPRFLNYQRPVRAKQKYSSTHSCFKGIITLSKLTFLCLKLHSSKPKAETLWNTFTGQITVNQKTTL